MSKLDELIKEYCPDGVEYKTIGDIAIDIYRGSGIKRDQVTEDGVPCVRYGEIYTTYNLWFTECVSHTRLEYVSTPKYFEYGDILFAITGESVEDIAKSIAYTGNDKCLAGGDIVVLKHNQDPKYLSYALSTIDAQMQKSKGKVKSKVVHSSVPAIKEIVLPVPPLEVQREIVRALDKFTLLTAELTAELTARKKQYEYYRNELLSFDNTVEFKPLGELFSYIRNGFVGTVTPFFTDEEHGVRYLEGTNIHDGVISDNEVKYVTKDFHEKYKRNELKADDILMVQSGHIGECAVVGKKYAGANCHALIIMSNGGNINSRFVCHYFHSYEGYKRLKPAMTGGTVKHVLATKMKDITIPVPSMEIQDRIVRVLDDFESICSDLNIGLPAEIDARQKQYEYYRDALLTFIEKDETILTEQNRTEQNRTEQT